MTRRALNRFSSARHVLVAEDQAVASAATAAFIVPIRDAVRGRFRAKCSTSGGTFTFRFMRPDAEGVYADDDSRNHADEAAADLVLADTSEGISANIEFYGEAFVYVEYTDDGGGSTIEHLTFSSLA